MKRSVGRSGTKAGYLGPLRTAFCRHGFSMICGWQPRLHQAPLIRVDPCPSVVVPSRSCSETPTGLVLNKRPGSSGWRNVRFLICVIREIRGEQPRLHRTHFTTVFPTSACSVGHLDPFRALGVFHGSQISSHRVSAVSFRLHLSVPAATSAVNSGEIRNNLQRSHRRHGPRRAAAATPAHPHPCRSVSIRGCPLAELFGNADRRG